MVVSGEWWVRVRVSAAYLQQSHLEIGLFRRGWLVDATHGVGGLSVGGVRVDDHVRGGAAAVLHCVGGEVAVLVLVPRVPLCTYGMVTA